MHEENESSASSPRRRRGAKSLIEQAAAIVGERNASGEGLGAVAQEERLRRWAEAGGHLISAEQWEALPLVSNATAEHEVRYRAADHRAAKRTWPGTFGFVPQLSGKNWKPAPATPAQYLQRLTLNFLQTTPASREQ